MPSVIEWGLSAQKISEKHWLYASISWRIVSVEKRALIIEGREEDDGLGIHCKDNEVK